MKKIPLYFFILFGVMILETVVSLALNAYSIGTCNILMGTKSIKQQSRLVENKYSLIPVRIFCNLIDANCKWINENKKVIVNYQKYSLELIPDSSYVVFNQKKIDLKVKPRINKNTFYIPVRAVSEILGIKVDWVDKTKTITLKSNGASIKDSSSAGVKQTINTKQTKTNIQAISKTQTSNNTQTNSKIQTTPNTQTNSKTQTSNKTQTNSKTQITANTQTNSKAQTSNNTQTNSKTQTTANTQTNSKTQTSNKTQTNSKTQITANTQTNSKIQTTANTQTKASIQSISHQASNIAVIDDLSRNRLSSGAIQGEPQINEPQEKVNIVPSAVPNYEQLENENIKYHNKNDRVYMELNGVLLQSGLKGQNKLYLDKLAPNGSNYEISFKSNIIKNDSILNINDEYLKSIQFVKQGEYSKIIFNVQQKLIFIISSSAKYNNSSITLIKESDSYQNMIVIDPGHGGGDPGAVFGDYEEKDLNLDISLRLKKLLDENNIKNYFTRQSDVFVELYDRSNIANSLKACLFLSIHNNAYNSTENGTETLFYGNGKKEGRIFANIIQNQLLQKIGFKDLGIIERPNLVVLRETVMPAALAEIGFITNKDNRTQLQKADTRQKAALALFDSIVETMKILKVN